MEKFNYSLSDPRNILANPPLNQTRKAKRKRK